MSRSAAGVSLVVTVTLLCLSAGVNPSTASATQDVFKAEEGSNVTLTCLFYLKTHTPATRLYIDIISMNLKRSIYRYNSESEAGLYEDELYRGRVSCNLELLKKGRIKCLFTDLRLNDTSTYIFIVVINEDSHSKECGLNVTEASHQPVDEPSEPVEPSSRGRIGLYMGGSLFTVMLTTLAILDFYT
ncbi:uncharacterized protein LOC119481888 isoform X4 [Sebastes umbrosus]|uniref:uncharacterized protein LOC119481888 isoform X4 n=1 Tax=Sebastes umbrosus TaxID=72105 RepID=UPI00189CE33A|nr:uncharacterized protein LOC119481888 isoform X4 [Sebastes umbrosus]XP_037615148.1 uncharacterized protein LOC119481888 isoform X4 [Sebastes umbrosus]